jgi:hypothetical protein
MPSAAAGKNGEEPEGSEGILSLFFAFPGQGSNALSLLHSRRLGISKIQNACRRERWATCWGKG